MEGEKLGNFGGPGLGPLGNISEELAGSKSLGLSKLTDIISTVIGVMTLGAAIWFIFQFLTGGINWMTSGGDKSKLEAARNRLTNAFLGLIIVVAGWGILALTGQFLGFDTLIGNPEEVINNLGL